MKEWLFSQFEHFNVFQFFLTVLFTVLWTRTNTNKEIKTMSQQIEKNFQRLGSECNQNTQLLSEQISMVKK